MVNVLIIILLKTKSIFFVLHIKCWNLKSNNCVFAIPLFHFFQKWIRANPIHCFIIYLFIKNSTWAPCEHAKRFCIIFCYREDICKKRVSAKSLTALCVCVVVDHFDMVSVCSLTILTLTPCQCSHWLWGHRVSVLA